MTATGQDLMAADTLAALSLVYVLLLVPAGVVGWPGPTSDPVPISELPDRLRLVYLGGGVSAVYAATAGALALVWPHGCGGGLADDPVDRHRRPHRGCSRGARAPRCRSVLTRHEVPFGVP